MGKGLVKPVLYFLLIALIPGCFLARKNISAKKMAQKVQEIEQKSLIGNQSIDAMVRLQEAKMSDIPLPISATPLPDYFDPSSSSIVLGYSDKLLSPEQLQQFFIQEMERSGWLLKEQFCTVRESLIRFKKPQRVCIISLREHNSKVGTAIVIFTGFTQDVIGQ